MRILISALLVLLGQVMSISDALAQDNSKISLEEQFQTMKQQSNNYQVYEVVKVSTLDAFWKSTNDTLKELTNDVANLQGEVLGLEKEVVRLGGTIAQRDAKLEKQLVGIESMEVLGMIVNKSSFLIFSFATIIVLLIVALVASFRFQRANKVTVQARKDASDMQEQLDAQRNKTRDIETKLKRELQTELNRVQELTAKLGKSS